MEKILKAAAYLRVSTLEQAKEGFSLAAQEEKLNRYATAMQYEIVDIYKDEGLSGSSLARPDLQRLIKDIRFGKIDIVIIYKLDRLSRKVKDILELVELFEKFNVKLFSLNENLDLSSSFGRAMLKMSATFSELERETITERMMMGKEQRVKQGRAMRNNVLPIGFDYDEKLKKFIPLPNEAEQVKKIFELYLQGWNYTNLSNYMAQNYKNRYSSYNDRTSVGKVLRNPFCCGYFWFNGNLHKAINIEPIVSYETWLKAESIRINTKQKLLRPCSPYLLTGLLYCAKCGARYVSKKYAYERTGKKGKIQEYERLCYGCTARVKRDTRYHPQLCDNLIFVQSDLDKQVEDALKKIKINNFKADNDGSTISMYQMQITELREKSEKVLDLYMNEVISKDQLESRLNSINKDIEKAQKLLTIERDNITPTPKIDMQAIRDRIANWNNLELIDKRLLLKTIIKKITIDGEKINIEWLVK